MVSLEQNLEPFMKLSNDVSETEFVKDIMAFIQNLCENCQLEFQNFLRKQVYDVENTNSVNLVSEVSNFTVLLFEDKFRYDNFYKIYIKRNSERSDVDFNLLVQLLDTLNDLCVGPCELNQKLFGRQKRLIKFCNYLA